MFVAFTTKDPPPSSAAKAVNFSIVQRSANPIYNSRYADGHVIDTDAASIELYSPVFSSFMDQFKHHRPSSEELSAASDYIQCSNALYINEAVRRNAIHVAMNKFFEDDPPVSSQLADSTAPDRIQYFRVTGREQMLAPIMVEEDKNEPGLGACDGSIQAAFSARRAWSQNACKIYREASCCPTLLLSTDGPNIAVYGSIITEFHVVQLLATASTVGCPDPDLREETVARLFVALGAAIRGLKSYYAGLKPASEQLPMPTCPWPTDIASRTDPSRSFTLRYIRPLYRGKSPDSKCITFLAKLDDDRQCVVKFSRRYSSRAHNVLAAARLAPTLLAIQTLEKTSIQMIVMDHVDGATLWQTRQNDGAIPPKMFEDLNEALRLLHKEKIVFGDLRDTNIILLKNPGEYCVNVVDFDWAAEHGQGRYPQLNTQQIKWADGMAWREPMFTHHDHEMLRFMHAEYGNNSLPLMVCECTSSASP
ncbi:hypothetical protein BKA62DRAFT_698867 [Auriculariales sp. MPI-PUGE-AT-0066]|nr:hypothetical protein BKA62DRAFT_698867 [Auriculariales sp. MPI-PUGE-AT-0066]